MKNLNKQTGQPFKIFWFGDMVAPSGFGRIGNEVCTRLRQRGYDVQAAGINYTGWPHGLPFWVWPLGNRDMWNGIVSIVNQIKPDVLISCQDFPYHHQLFYGCRIDFSRLKWIWITPIDGTPIHPEWAKLVDMADAGMVISKFGVEAMRQAGKRVALCHPGVNTTEFYPADADEKAALRAAVPKKPDKLDYGPDDFIIGVVCMNQGRKAISKMAEAFHEFARDKSNARLLLDMDKTSPAGWDIPALLKQMGWSDDEQKRVRYRDDLFARDGDPLSPLRNRYVLMDAHMVISHREGFGLPLLESMACRIPTIALDWCSGSEIASDGRGVLIERIGYMEHGAWGGARDAFPNMGDLIRALNMLYRFPQHAANIAETGYQWAIQQTWDVTTDQVEAVIHETLNKEKQSHVSEPNRNPAPGLSDVYGPAAGAPGDAIGNHPVIQRPAASDSMPPVADRDGPDGGQDGSAANSGTG